MDQDFDQIVEQYSTAVYRLAYKFTHNQDDAEDIAQETFFRAYKNLLTHPKEVNMKPWLMTICVNLCRNLAKKKKNFNFSELERVDDEGESMKLDVADESPGTHEKVRKNEEAGIVREAVGMLPEKYQVVLQLRYTEDLSYQEISDILSLPLNTVKVHLRRAKNKLEIHLKALLG